MDTTAKIARPYYINWLDSWKDKDIIKVVTGIRRSGKTTLLELFREKLVSNKRQDPSGAPGKTE